MAAAQHSRGGIAAPAVAEEQNGQVLLLCTGQGGIQIKGGLRKTARAAAAGGSGAGRVVGQNAVSFVHKMHRLRQVYLRVRAKPVGDDDKGRRVLRRIEPARELGGAGGERDRLPRVVCCNVFIAHGQSVRLVCAPEQGGVHDLHGSNGADKINCQRKEHNAPQHAGSSGHSALPFEKRPAPLWGRPLHFAYCFGSRTVSTSPAARPARPCSSEGMMIFVALPSATFCMASSALSLMT